LVSDKLLEKPKDDSIKQIAEIKQKIAEKSQDFFSLYQQGTSGLIKRQAVEKDVESLKKQLDSLTKTSEKDSQSSPLLQNTEINQNSNRLTELEELHEKFKNETRANEKRTLRKRINNLEHAITSEHLTEIEDNLRKDILKLEADLKSEVKYLEEVLKKNDETPKLKRLRREIEIKHKKLVNIETAQTELAEMDFSKSKPFFLWKLQFSEIFRDKGGFDIVIANPPYIQLQKSSGELSKQYENSGYETFEKTGDIYSLFYETGFKVLKDKGSLIFITSNKWMRAAYGAKTRKFFSDKTNPLLLIDFAGQKIFETATVDTSILMFSKEKNQENTSACIVKDKVLNNLSLFIRHNSINCKFSGSDSWVVLTPIERQIKEKIEQRGTPLKDWDISINYGIKTGFNDAFIITGEKRKELILDDPKSAEIIRPILRGRDIKRYSHEFADLWLLFIPWHFPLHNDPTIKGASKEAEKAFKAQYSAIYNHLLQYKSKLSNRNKAETGIRYEWYALQRWGANYWEDFSKQKIVWADLARTGNAFTYDSSNSFLLNTCYILTLPSENEKILKFILGVLNSKLMLFYMDIISSKLDETGWRWFKQFVEILPIPFDESKLSEIAFATDLIIKNKTDRQKMRDYEKELNTLIYKLFELSDEEVVFIDSMNVISSVSNS
jgi:adenine-specific DNA-methyltransferase